MNVVIQSLFPSASSSILQVIHSYLMEDESQNMLLSLYITNNNLEGLKDLLLYEDPHLDFLLLHCGTFNAHHKPVFDYLVSQKRQAFVLFAQKGCGCIPSEPFWETIYLTLTPVEAISFVDKIFQESLPHEFIKAATHLLLFFKHHSGYANDHGFYFLEKLLVGGGFICRFLPFLLKEKVITFLDSKRGLLLTPDDFELHLLSIYFDLPPFKKISKKN